MPAISHPDNHRQPSTPSRGARRTEDVLKESKNTSGARRKTRTGEHCDEKHADRSHSQSADCTQQGGCFAPTSLAATHTGAEKTTTNPTNAAMAGKPVRVRTKFAPFCLLGMAV